MFEIRYFLSLLQLNQSNFEEGWKNFSFRWHSHVNNSKFLKVNLPIYQKGKIREERLKRKCITTIENILCLVFDL